MNNHILLVGLGHLGYRVALKLHEMGEQVVAIEFNANADTLNVIRNLGIPVIHEDATRPAALESANVKNARAIILASQNDAMNLQIALKARSMNPKITVVIRVFDEDFAHALQEQFGFTALSATEMAAPVFASSASGVEFTNPISVEGESLSLARFRLSPNSELVGKTVGQVEDGYSVSIVLVRHDHTSELHPTDSLKLNGNELLAVLGRPEKLNALIHASQ